MSGKEIRVLGVDTSLRSTGIGVVEGVGSRLSLVEYDVLKTTAQWPLSRCLLRIYEGIAGIIEQARPEAVSIEGIFYCRNPRTAVILGEARGAAVAACAARGMPVFEYAPRRVKQAVVGFGGAGKEQVRRMVMSLLALKEEPPEDAADALAMAICHIHSRRGIGLLAPKAI